MWRIPINTRLAADTSMGAVTLRVADLDSEAALAAAVRSVATHAPRTFTGSADHLVSNAFYFDDPEGNGVELYWGRARSSWTWMNGTVQMSTDHLDPATSFSEHRLLKAWRTRSSGRRESAMCTSAW